MHVQQHALEGHAPCLQGPLQMISAEGSIESLLSLARSGDTCVGMCALRCACVTCYIMPPSAALILQGDALHALREQVSKPTRSQQIKLSTQSCEQNPSMHGRLTCCGSAGAAERPQHCW